jgi:Fe-S oxidoreductase
MDDAADSPTAAVQRCLTCGVCEVRCPQGVHFADWVRGLREQIPAECRWPCPHGQTFESLAHLMAGAVPSRDTAWLGDDLKVAEQGEVALFVGCLPFFDAYFGEDLGLKMLEIARAAIRLLNQQGIEPVVATDERCCGHDLLWGGDRESFEKLAAANAASFAARGVKRIVTACAECCRTWRLDYAEAVPGYRPQVQHVAELMAEAVESGRLELSGNETVTYQDPCRLGRQLGVVDEPRRVLSAMTGTSLVEMERSGRDAQCCGSPGFTHCDATSRALQTARLEDARNTGAGQLLTACPKCLIHLRCAQAESQRQQPQTPSIEIRDLTVYVASRMSSTGKPQEVSSARAGRPTGGEP